MFFAMRFPIFIFAAVVMDCTTASAIDAAAAKKMAYSKCKADWTKAKYSDPWTEKPSSFNVRHDGNGWIAWTGKSVNSCRYLVHIDGKGHMPDCSACVPNPD